MRSYAQMDASEIKLDRYAKFRRLGRYEEFLVAGGQWAEARQQRENVSPPLHLSPGPAMLGSSNWLPQVPEPWFGCNAHARHPLFGPERSPQGRA